MDNWHVVHVASGLLQANIIKGRLETEGIPVRLSYEAAGKIYAITVAGLGEVRILVPQNTTVLAKEILAHSFREEDLDWERR
ncbi:MAG: DUF2007 domain-containing protein [Syntrophales bacterium]|jgi:hypothetical protein|nr:DUF2007 domain-containing protein [Syntrophales bacterium]NLN60243.1 hypothetical protein [Deltaproteobacteria bacterium]